MAAASEKKKSNKLRQSGKMHGRNRAEEGGDENARQERSGEGVREERMNRRNGKDDANVGWEQGRDRAVTKINVGHERLV